jgi:hypothetical protein
MIARAPFHVNRRPGLAASIALVAGAVLAPFALGALCAALLFGLACGATP